LDFLGNPGDGDANCLRTQTQKGIRFFLRRGGRMGFRRFGREGEGLLTLVLSVALPAALLLAVGAAGDTGPGKSPAIGVPATTLPRSRLPHLALPASRRLRGGGNAASRFQYALDVARREVDGGWEEDFDFDGEEEEEEEEADSEEERQLRAMAATRRRMASAAAAKEEDEEEDNATPGAREQKERPKAESPKVFQSSPLP
jgi:hypothetical protein